MRKCNIPRIFIKRVDMRLVALAEHATMRSLIDDEITFIFTGRVDNFGEVDIVATLFILITHMGSCRHMLIKYVQLILVCHNISYRVAMDNVSTKSPIGFALYVP